ncbi:Rv2231c family pyridoxal phosphate-dependent protein CobC [Nocardioides marinus]|uniref:Histidinol-phosphate/aromatic aminotransferase/cobyric acid decarboxylase-like protein n=1 Tax=Nocardioides marinus TaxID=374514 RepID=A0A7Y9YCB5_9ACTN|nr:histidinol-phosphate/aromatic aminotransferase/cobyric acid decarboxylase-like protein [Nocardioides marinus]
MAEHRAAGPTSAQLLHHGDAEVRGSGLLDLAVNVHPHGPPAFLREALEASVADVAAYPDAGPAERALATHHGRFPEEVLATAGATEAFTLLARLRPWRCPVVVHPQFTEPHAALVQAGHEVRTVLLSPGDTLGSASVPEEADLVVLGNPTNPTGTLHPRAEVAALVRPGRLVVVDEAFMDALPGEPESWVGRRHDGLVVVRSLTKSWAVPGVRAGYLVGDPVTVSALRAVRPPWTFSAAASATVHAVTSARGLREQRRRARELQQWRVDLQDLLLSCGVPFVPSVAPFVLARPGVGAHEHLREQGIAVRRCDTFPGLGPEWVRVAARPRAVLAPLGDVLAGLSPGGCPAASAPPPGRDPRRARRG